MRHDDRNDDGHDRSVRDLMQDCGDLIAEEERADDLRVELAASCDRIRQLRRGFSRLAMAGRARQIYADPYIEGVGYAPRLIEVYPDGTVRLSPVERLSDLIAPAVTAEPTYEAAIGPAMQAYRETVGPDDRAIEAAHAVAAWDRPGDDDPNPLTDEMVLEALRSVERDDDD